MIKKTTNLNYAFYYKGGFSPLLTSFLGWDAPLLLPLLLPPTLIYLLNPSDLVKRTVSEISSDPLFKDDNARFTTIRLKL